MMMNYLEILPDTPTRVHFSDHYFVDRMIWDKDLQKEKPVRSLVLWVDAVGGVAEYKTFSILSKKLYALLEPYLPDSRFRDFDFLITKTGENYQTEWTVEAIPKIPD